MSLSEVSRDNAELWNELCGSGLARSLGIEDSSPASLKKFDDWYFDFYPYLFDHIPFENLKGRDVLEMGHGYGTASKSLPNPGGAYRARYRDWPRRYGQPSAQAERSAGRGGARQCARAAAFRKLVRLYRGDWMTQSYGKFGIGNRKLPTPAPAGRAVDSHRLLCLLLPALQNGAHCHFTHVIEGIHWLSGGIGRVYWS